MTTQEYIWLHADDDVRQLALRGAKDEAVDLPFALNQIRGRQNARVKIPSWASVDAIIYPQHLSLEQCSSEATARYKAELVAGSEDVGRFVDLTGGLGVDFSFMSRCFSERIYVEHNADLCQIVRHNMPLLGIDANIVQAEAEDFLLQMPEADVVFLDPARRNSHGGRTYALADCTPNVLSLLPLLRQKARRIILKLSPMLDWRKAVRDVVAGIEEQGEPDVPHFTCIDVHIISVDNECKELMLDISSASSSQVFCVNIKDGDIQRLSFSYNKEEYHPVVATIPLLDSLSTTPWYLFEPNASIMKAGCFATLCRLFGVVAIAPNSHLFIGKSPLSDFPGRQFRVIATSTMNKKELRHMLSAVDRANISVRNFPLSAEELRRRLKLKDGGTYFLFATTDTAFRHILLLAEKE